MSINFFTKRARKMEFAIAIAANLLIIIILFVDKGEPIHPLGFVHSAFFIVAETALFAWLQLRERKHGEKAPRSMYAELWFATASAWSAMAFVYICLRGTDFFYVPKGSSFRDMVLSVPGLALVLFAVFVPLLWRGMTLYRKLKSRKSRGGR
ncbi:MAG: hypothetical protein LBN02_02595 [Oscillospiraceae bacterium]|nr:hypothetical protein [Oscillospiraceae bacterium]